MHTISEREPCQAHSATCIGEFIMYKIFLATILVVFLIFASASESFGGGDSARITTSVGSDMRCINAHDPKTPLPFGASCELSINFEYSSTSSGRRARGVSYWIEGRPIGSDRFKKISRTHIFNFFGKAEKLKLRLNESLELKVVFDVGGDPNFGEYESNTWLLRSRDPKICRFAEPDLCYKDEKKVYFLYLTSLVYVSKK